MARLEGDEPEALRPEGLDDEAWDDLLDAVENGAEQRHLDERARLVAAGVIDAQGRILKEPVKAIRSDDGGGW